MGCIYLDGGLEKEGIELLKSIPTSTSALYRLGQHFYEMETPPAQAESLVYFEKGAQLNDANSLYWLGYVYHQGLCGKQPNPQKAVRLLNEAIQLGHKEAMYYLAVMYKSGDGVVASNQQAIELLNRATSEPDPCLDALFMLGSHYLNGDLGLNKNPKAALRFFNAAARLGHVDATLNAVCSDWILATHQQGIMYYSGIGTEINMEKAYYHYQNASLAVCDM